MDEFTAASALRESEELHRITLLNMSDAVFITDEAGAFTFVCPNADVIFGYSADEVRAMGTIARLLGAELLEPGAFDSLDEIRNIEHAIRTRHGDHRVLLVHIKRVAIRGGTVLYVCRDITERKRAEEALRQNEERLSLALEAAAAGTWDWHVPTGEMCWSRETHRMFGDPALDGPPSFNAFLARVHPGDRDRVARTMVGAMDRGSSYETEFRLEGADAEAAGRWVLGKGRALRNGKPIRMLGVFVDVTDRHRAEQELRDLGGRLINAHEQERVRLSEELHDNLGQRLAVLSAELGSLRQELADSPRVHHQLMNLSGQLTEIGAQLHRVSHELHPAWLKQLGLASSIRGLCEGLSRASGLRTDVDIRDVPDSLHADIALGLFRIAQEALHNVVKHSRASSVTVSLICAAGQIVLAVEDDGVGFEPGNQKNGLGLVSMRERARLLDGRFSVGARPGHGTRVEVRLPAAGAPPA